MIYTRGSGHARVDTVEADPMNTRTAAETLGVTEAQLHSVARKISFKVRSNPLTWTPYEIGQAREIFRLRAALKGARTRVYGRR